MTKKEHDSGPFLDLASSIMNSKLQTQTAVPMSTDRERQLYATLVPLARQADFYKPEVLDCEQVSVPLAFLRAARLAIPGDLPTIEQIIDGRVFGHSPEKGERIPSGWKLVPVEPTERMLTTGSTARYHAGDKLGHATTRDVWTAMLAASPPPAKAEDGIEIVREAREHVALRLDGMERIGATAEAKRSARSLLQRMDAALAKEGTP